MELLWKSCWQSVVDQNGGRVFLVHVCTAYLSVETILKSQFLYKLRIGKLLVVSRGPIWQSSFSRTCLYSVCERGKNFEIAILLWTSYWKVVGNQSKTKMAAKFLSYMSAQRMWVRENPKIAIFVWNCYGKVVSNQSRTKMVVESFSYTPIQCMWAWETS